MTLEHDLLQLARDAMRTLMNGRDFSTGQTGYYLNIIRRIEDELSRPQPEQERVTHTVDIGVDVTTEGTYVIAAQHQSDGAREVFYAQWHPLLKPEQEPVCSKDPHQCGFVQCQLGKVCKHTAQPEQAVVPFPSFMRKRIEQAMKDAINPKGMSVHDGKVKVLVSDLHRMLLVIDSAPPKREWVGLTSEDWENTPDTGKKGCERDVEMFDWVEQTLKDKNT